MLKPKRIPTALERINLSRQQKRVNPLAPAELLGAKKHRLWLFGHKTRKGEKILERFNARRIRTGLPPLTYEEIREAKIKETEKLKKELMQSLKKKEIRNFMKEAEKYRNKYRSKLYMRDYIKSPAIRKEQNEYSKTYWKKIKKNKKLYEKKLKKQRNYSKSHKNEYKQYRNNSFIKWGEADDFLSSIGITRENSGRNTYIELKHR